MTKILTCCSQGLCRSVGLADVLKMHFEPVDVIPIGLNSNSPGTKEMLFDWADFIVLMESHFVTKIDTKWHNKILVCEVGKDNYGNARNSSLIDICWRWTRTMEKILNIQEHSRRI